ncbi:PC-Esterase protein [Dioscorea alata]|uniref:PC-Esterase protein n=1 Tax=Dioscorea alata TaxID=55571 RepID=A0ACB7WBX0_DIOAL|nr:PC-Esterase protein [Dioscorea alata]
MTMASKKGLFSAFALARTAPAIIVMVGAFGLMLFVLSQLLISSPVYQWRKPANEPLKDIKEDIFIKQSTSGSKEWNASRQVQILSSDLGQDEITVEPISSNEMQEEGDSKSSVSSNEIQQQSKERSSMPSNEIQEQIKENRSTSSNEMQEPSKDKSSMFSVSSVISNDTDENLPPSSNLASNLSPVDGIQKVDSGSCDLLKGKWVYHPAGPLYTNNTCMFITQMQNCQGNGRPDKEYENWRWKPDDCDLPLFDGRKFLELMRDKTVAFVGDSVARNQFESMLCILSQVETPRNRGNRLMQRWHFKSTNAFLCRIWSSWLVHQSSEPLQLAPKEVAKIHLDIPDETFMNHLPKFDVVILSSGHWFAKQSAYVLNGNIVGGQLWWPKGAGKMQINNIKAFGISVETTLTAIAAHPNYTGLVIVRSFSPDHYEGGAWNTGGSCTGKTGPADKFERNGFTDIMHEKQVAGFKKAVKKARPGSKLRLMDITEAFSYRHDGHPGPYRSPDPNKITKRGPNGEPPPQDCLHWCMPGPVDTWNEILVEMIRREFEAP